MLPLVACLACAAPQKLPSSSCAAAGYYEGTAISGQAGALPISLNLRCTSGDLGGELTTPQGSLDVKAATHDTSLELTLDGGSAKLVRAGTELRGTFALGGDTGSVTLARRGDARPRSDGAPTLALPAAKWREDVDYFAREVAAQHANAFFHTPRDQFDAAIAQLDRDLDHLDGDQVYFALDRIACAIGDGHTYVQLPDGRAAMPLDIALFDGAYRIEGVLAGNEAALGAQIVAIDGTPIAAVLAALRPLTAADETTMLAEARLEDFLTLGMILHGAGVAAKRDTIAYTLSNGSVLQLHGVAAHELEQAPWIHPFHDAPRYLAHRDRGLDCEMIDAAHTLYCNFRDYDHLDEHAKAMFDLIGAQHPAKLVLDMRFNGGGDYTRGEKLLIDPLRAMPELNRKGHLFVLISAYTFSAAMSNAAQFRAKTAALLGGQTIGERPNSYQEPRSITLPESHLVVRVSTKLYHFTDGAENLIRPDRELPRTWADYAAGRDAVLDWALAY